MSEHVILRREFLLRSPDGRNVDAIAKLAKLSGNRHAHFSLTCQNGAAHDLILASAPDEVADDLRLLADMHLRDEHGIPSHAVANTITHVRDGNFDAALRTLGGVGTREGLQKAYGEAATLDISTRAAAVEAHREAVGRSALQFKAAHEVVARQAARRREGISYFGPVKRDTMALDEARKELATLLFVKPESLDDARALELAKHPVLPAGVAERVRKANERKVFEDTFVAYIDETCLAVWQRHLTDAKEALARPDYLAKGRPRIEDDATTYKGFVSTNGLEFSFQRATSNPGMVDMRKDARHFRYELRGPDGFVDGHYSKGDPKATSLAAEEVLETLQSEFSSVETMGRDEFIEEYGYASDGVAGVRKGEDAYDTIKGNRDAFVEAFGPEAYQALMTRVGDSPPLSEDYFAERTPSPGM